MRRFGLIICLAALFAIASGACAGSASVPAHDHLEPGSLYVGESGEIRVELRLLEENFFVLLHVFTPRGGAAATRDFTGVWRQVESGTLLQLTNRHGLALRFNIGGGGNLYGDVCLVSGMPPWSLTLKKSPWRAQAFSLMGRLDRPASPADGGAAKSTEAGPARLTDSASGRVFALENGPAPGDLPPENPLFVDAEVRMGTKGLVVEKIRSFSRSLPSSARGVAAADDAAADFAGAAEGQTWMLSALPGVPEASCFFSGRGEGRGVLEVAGPGLRLVVAVEELPGRRLLFRIRERDARMLRAAGFDALPGLFAGEYRWSREGDALALAASDDRRLLLEKCRD